MRVLVFSPYYPPHIGGLESHSEEFNRHLSKTGVEVLVFTPRLPIESPEEEIRDGVRIIRFPAFEIISNYPLPKYWPFFWIPEFWRSFRSLWKYQPDIVISRTRFFSTSLLALIYARLRGIRLIHIEHGSDFVQLSSPFKTLLARLYDHTFGRIIFRCSDLNISISAAVRQFIKKFDQRTSPVIYRGLNFDELDQSPENVSLRQEHPEKIIIATAARLYKWKGIENTIGAIRSLPEDTRSKIIFFIIGDGEDFDRLQKLSSGLPIQMLGKLERTDVIGILKASDIYIHSSLPGGGLSTSLLEAMYCQCAIIATPDEGADEIIKNTHNGLLIEKSSPKLLYEALSQLIENQTTINRLSRQAVQDVRARFNWNKSIEQYKEIFDQIQHDA